ncbi:cytochrome P450 4B1-like [Platysternon megacephalum]|uniref:Cytochrome P450 4B1-like n=1 Tax=Platysternon megacephalum TaxID=55544 RepID=A0A4D9DUV8_9SAUR|nr:cytochrome P450 4B1-like [Platysternon megacephalum]
MHLPQFPHSGQLTISPAPSTVGSLRWLSSPAESQESILSQIHQESNKTKIFPQLHTGSSAQLQAQESFHPLCQEGFHTPFLSGPEGKPGLYSTFPSRDPAVSKKDSPTQNPCFPSWYHFVPQPSSRLFSLLLSQAHSMQRALPSSPVREPSGRSLPEPTPPSRTLAVSF